MKKSIHLVLALIILISLFSGCASNESAKMATMDDLNNKRIGVYTGTIYDKFAVQKFPQATIMRYNSISDFVVALKNNKIDGAISNLYSAKNVIKTNPEIGILTDEVLSFDIGIGFSKQNPALREKFNAYLKAIKADGSFDAMYKKWFENDPEKVPMPKFQPDPAGEKITLAVATGDLPNVGVVNNQYVGFDIELIQTFAMKEKMNLDIVTMDFSALIAALASGKADMIADCIAITAERAAQVDFSDPYMKDKSAIIVMKDKLADSVQSKGKAVTVADLAKKKVGVLQGSVHDSYMNKNYPGAQVSQYKSYPDLILAVKSGKVDSGFITTDAFKQVQKEDKSLEMLVDNVFSVPIGVGFNKDNDSLREEFNKFLKEIKANGVLDDLNKRWFKDDNMEMPVIDNKKNNGKLIVGNVSDKGMPYTVVKNNRLIGSDIELIERFAAYLGKEVVYSDMEFGNLIAAVSTNKVDMVVSTLMITEERKKQIDFSDPYNELTACAFGAVQKTEAAVPFYQCVADSFYNNIILEDRYLLILDGLKTTVIISIFSILFGTLLGALICFMRMSKRKVINAIARMYISLLRGLPVLVFLMIIFYVVFAKVNIDPVLVAVLAFGMNFAAYVSEMFRTAIGSVDKGQTEAGIASGFTKVQTFGYIVMPQAIRQVLPVYKGELISLVKMTSIVGYIAVQDLTKASDIIRSRTFDAFFPLIMTAVLYFIISALLIMLLDMVEHRTDPKARRKAGQKKNKLVVIIPGILAAVAVIAVFVTSVIPKGTASNEQINNLDQLEGKRICVVTGTTGDFAVRARYKNVHVLDMNYPADSALAVQSNKADAFVYDKATLEYIVSKSNGKFELIPEKLDSVDIAIPMRLEDKALHKNINQCVAEFKKDGTLDTMYKKWFLDTSGKAPSMPKIALDGKNGTLRMGTCLMAEPFAFLSNGEKVGFDIELAYRIAEKMGYKLEITDMSYDAMIASLQAGKIDIAIANFYKLESRTKLFEFSDPYMTNDISAMVRREKK